MIPATYRSFSTGDLDLQGQGQACRGHHLKNHLNRTGSQTTFYMPLKIGIGILGTLPNNSVTYRSP